MQLLTPSRLLADGFGLSADGATDTATCAMCGFVCETLPANALLSVSTSGIPDLLRSGGDRLCPSCAACFAASKQLVGGLLAVQGLPALRPMVSRASATAERPAWHDLLVDMAVHHRHTPCVAVLTLNTKRRLWPAAPVSTFGATWRPLLVEADVERVLTVDVDEMLLCLDDLAVTYEAGFTKAAIARSLLSERPKGVSVADALYMESRIAPWRGRDVFLLSLFIVQKELS